MRNENFMRIIEVYCYFTLEYTFPGYLFHRWKLSIAIQKFLGIAEPSNTSETRHSP